MPSMLVSISVIWQAIQDASLIFFNLKASSLPTLASTFEMSSVAADLSKSMPVPIQREC